jgi:hypothetical protein
MSAAANDVRHIAKSTTMKVTLPRSVLLPAASSPALWLPRPGTKRGPCVQSCLHPHCMGMRELAVLPCSICGRALGWEALILQLGSGFDESTTQVRPIHGLCVATLRYPG